MSNIIAAISTPIAISSVSIVRISGEDCFSIINNIFKPFKNRNVLNAKGYTSMYGHIIYNDEIIDEVIVHFYKKPYSYTGEDVVEISCHGGIYIVKKVLDIVLKCGAKLSKAGEFTMRAVLNGKMTLTQAEGVMDLINSREKQSFKIAMNERNGQLFNSINSIKKDVLDIISNLAAFIDYPEEEIDEIGISELEKRLTTILARMETIVNTYNYGTIMKNGVDTAIIGKTNVGKSSIMNLLSRDEKSIVTDIEGTTRDIIQNTIQLPNVILNLNDTAGIRKTEDVVESIGAELSFKKIKTSNLILAVFDGSRELDDNDIKIIKEVDKDISIAIINKCDKHQKIDIKEIQEKFKHIVLISAITGDGLKELEEKIEEVLNINHTDISYGVISNERQKYTADQALEFMKIAFNSVKTGMSLDAIVLDLEQTIEALMELTGENVNEEVIKAVFSNFCVGK